MSKVKTRRKVTPSKPLFVALLALMTMSAIVFNSCNVTRTVTTRSESHTYGDSTVIIQSKTIESYDGVKKP